MRRVNRGAGPPPGCLAARNKAGLTELERAREHHKGWTRTTESFDFTAYKGAEVRHRLERLFHGKCAYCEANYRSGSPVDIEHFRPKGSVHGEPERPGYWWLAMEWGNLLPSCIDCNRWRKQHAPSAAVSLLELYEESRAPNGWRAVKTGKQNCFPIAGTRACTESMDLRAEQPLLLNPCEDDPDEHLHFYVEGTPPVSLVVPKRTDAAPQGGDVPLPRSADAYDEVAEDARDRALSVRGAVSIQVYGLNRLGLVQDRTRVLRRLEFLGTLVIELESTAEMLERAPLAPALDQSGAVALVQRIRGMASLVMAEIRHAASPEMPYSTIAAAWIRRFVATI